jgi:hypothetical protein
MVEEETKQETSNLFLLHGGFLLGLFNDHENGGHKFLRILS